MDDLAYNILLELEDGKSGYGTIYKVARDLCEISHDDFNRYIKMLDNENLVTCIYDKSELFKDTPNKIFITTLGKQAFKEEHIKRNNK